MLRRRIYVLFRDPLWSNISTFSLILFFIFVADAILSYWVPNFLLESLGGNSFLMGIIFSFSSVVGFLADLVFPQLLRNFSVRKLILSAIIVSLIFIANLGLGTKYPYVPVFLLSMAVWGIYYEFLGFATQQFVADTIPLKMHSSGWAIIGVFKNLAYFLGPLFAAWLLIIGEYLLLTIVLLFVLISALIFGLTKKGHQRPITIEVSEVNLWKEISHWRVLSTKIWPIIILSLFIGAIDATFWTTGATWTNSLSQENFWGQLLLPAYQLPALFMGFLMVRWKIYKGKKKMAEIFLLITGLILALLWFKLPTPFYVLIVFASSLTLSVVYPLVDAVYSDITFRMGVERKHLVGLSGSTTSLSYIISPALAGFIAGWVGERMTFVVIGTLCAMVSLALLATTPKKLRLPETEIEKWED